MKSNQSITVIETIYRNQTHISSMSTEHTAWDAIRVIKIHNIRLSTNHLCVILIVPSITSCLLEYRITLWNVSCETCPSIMFVSIVDTFWIFRSIAATSVLWASCQIPEIAGCACDGNAWNVFRASAGWRSKHASRHVTHVPWCMSGSLASGFLWSQWLGKRSRRICKQQLYVSGKRPIYKIIQS